MTEETICAGCYDTLPSVDTMETPYGDICDDCFEQVAPDSIEAQGRASD